MDSYGGMGRHGGGAFRGKDPSKVDRSAAYMGRYVAKNIVAAGLAAKREIQFAYAIGYPDPVSVQSTPSAPAWSSDDAIIERACAKVFSFKPADIIKQLNLLRPIYSQDDQLRPLRQERSRTSRGSARTKSRRLKKAVGK